jgi:hypothetical protein
MNTSALMLILLLSTSIGGSELKIARVLKTTDLDSRLLQEMGARILSDEHQDYLDIIVEEGDIPALTGRGYQLRDLVPLELSGLTDIDPEYHTFEEVTAELESLAVAYPQLCKLDSIGHAQQFNRTIWCMKVSDNVQTEEDEIAVLYIGTHHACEVMGCETLLYMINHLLEN